MNRNKNPKAVTNSIKLEAKKPINDPKAAFNADLELDLLTISPINAPTNGPIMIPKGTGKTIPTTNPKVAPIIPNLLPPAYLVPKAGIIRFRP